MNKRPKILPNPPFIKEGVPLFHKEGLREISRGSDTRHPSSRSSIADRIVGRIAKEHLEPRSETSILIEQVGYLSLVALFITLVALTVNWIGFELRRTGILGFTDYGTEGYRAILEALPYSFLLLCLAGLGGTMLAIRHFDISYRRPLFVLAGVLVVSIGIGSLLAVSGVNEELAEQADRDEAPQTIAHRLYHGTLTVQHHSTRLIIGPVVGQADGKLRIVVPPQRLIEVVTDDNTQYPLGKPTVGDQVRVLVIRQDNSPTARVILLGPGKRLLPEPQQQ